MEKKLSYQELSAQLDDALARLAEAEGIISSIKTGSVDALITENDLLVMELKSIADEKKKILEQIKRTAWQWEKTFHAIDSPIFLVDADSNILRSNDAAKKFYGNNSQIEFSGKCHDLICKCSVADKDCPLTKSKKSLKRENKVFFRDGKWIDEIADPYLDENNKFEGAVLICSDITESKKAEILLRDEEAKFRSVSETASDAIIVGNSAGEIIFWNKSAQKIFGYSEKEALNKPITLIIPHELQKKHSDALQNFVETKHPKVTGKTVEMEGLSKNGDLVPIELAISYWENQNDIFFSAIIRDITEKKLALKALIAAKEKAEEMNKIKSFFFANMSHELRTPFVGIMGYAELLAEELENVEHKEMADGIIDASQRMLQTLDNILSLTKIEFDGLVVKYEPININEIISSILTEHKPHAEAKNLAITHNLLDEQAFINTDKQLLQGILSNLISNALKYTEAGRIEVFADIEKYNDTDFLNIKVIDTGIGIPEDKHEQIWQEFRQVSEGTNRGYQGTGLGLAITKKYVEKLGGNIRVESKVGEGSTFIVNLPILKEEDALLSNTSPDEKETIAEVDANQKLKNILYIEDDNCSQDIVKKALSDICNIDLTNNANIAELSRDVNKYDAFLIDINLGSTLDGVETMLRIKKIKGYEKTPMIAITAYASEEDKEEFLSKGFTHYISKPFRMNELRKLIAGL